VAKMKKVLMITYDNCDDSEVQYPLYRLWEENFVVDVASIEKRTIKAKYHFTIEATLTLDEVRVKDYDALFLPGGTAPEKIRLQPIALDIVREFNVAGKPIGAICHGQLILISAGLIKGRQCTCYIGVRDDLINAGGIYSDERVVVDGNFVTSRHPNDLPFCLHEFIKLIKSK